MPPHAHPFFHPCDQTNTVCRHFERIVQAPLIEKFMFETRLTHFIKPTINLSTDIELISSTSKEMDEFIALLAKRNITAPSSFQVENCQHFVVKKDNNVVAGMSVLSSSINNSKVRMCSSIEFIVSVDRGAARKLLNMLRVNLVKRRGACIMVTQAFKGKLATDFWMKHMPKHKEAEAINFMMYMLTDEYKLCEDVIYLRSLY